MQYLKEKKTGSKKVIQFLFNTRRQTERETKKRNHSDYKR